LDLRGLRTVLGDRATDLDVAVAVGALLRVFRTRRVVSALIDLREAWTGLPEILGNFEDRVYERLDQTRQPDGSMLLVLRQRRPRTARARPALGTPPSADLTVLRVRRSRARLGHVDVRVAREGHRPAWVSVPVGTVPAGAVASAVAAVVGPSGARRVIVVGHPELRAILLPQPGLDGVARPCQPVFVPLRMAQDRLSLWKWTLDPTGCWLVGMAG